MHYRALLENASAIVLNYVSTDGWSLEQEDIDYAAQSASDGQ